MKKSLMISLFLLVSNLVCFSEDVDIVYVCRDGSEFIEKIDKNEKAFGFFASEESKYNNVVTVKGLEQLVEVEEASFYMLRYINDFSFLSDLKNLRKLHIASCTINNLKFLEKLQKLEYLSINFYVPDEFKDKIRNERINLEKLKNLTEIYYCDGLGTIPRFYNLVENVKINLSNNCITKFSKEDVKLLNQYSEICLLFNPVTENVKEMDKLNGMNVIYKD